MIPYMVGKLAPNLNHSTKKLVKYVPGRGDFRAVSSQNGDKIVTSPLPPIVERIATRTDILKAGPMALITKSLIRRNKRGILPFLVQFLPKP